MTYGLFDALKDAVLGNLDIMKKEESDRRMEICKRCDFYNAVLSTCTICHCYLPEKTRYLKSECADSPRRW